MVPSDWAECPCCRFPASAAQFIRILAAERRCPMCNEEVGGGGRAWMHVHAQQGLCCMSLARLDELPLKVFKQTREPLIPPSLPR